MEVFLMQDSWTNMTDYKDLYVTYLGQNWNPSREKVSLHGLEVTETELK